MGAVKDLLAVPDPPGVYRVRQDVMDVASVEGLAARRLTRRRRAASAPETDLVRLILDGTDRARTLVEIIECSDRVRLGLVDLKCPAIGIITHGDLPTHPEPLPL